MFKIVVSGMHPAGFAWSVNFRNRLVTEFKVTSSVPYGVAEVGVPHMLTIALTAARTRVVLVAWSTVTHGVSHGIVKKVWELNVKQSKSGSPTTAVHSEKAKRVPAREHHQSISRPRDWHQQRTNAEPPQGLSGK